MCLEKEMVIRVEKANEDTYIYILKGEKIRVTLMEKATSCVISRVL